MTYGIMRHHSNHSDTRMESDNLNILNRASHEGQSLAFVLRTFVTFQEQGPRKPRSRRQYRRRQRLLTSEAAPRKPQRTRIDVAIIAIVTVRNPTATKLSCHG